MFVVAAVLKNIESEVAFHIKFLREKQTDEWINLKTE